VSILIAIFHTSNAVLLFMKSLSISLLLPTRGRPALVERFLKSIVETTTNLDQVEVILYVDNDDTGSHHLDSEEVRVVRIIGPALLPGSMPTTTS
jgi:hypothetical protein